MLSEARLNRFRYSGLIALIVTMSLNSVYAQANGTIDENRTFNVVVGEPAAGDGEQNCIASIPSWSPSQVAVFPAGQNAQPGDPIRPGDTLIAVVATNFQDGRHEGCGAPILPAGTVEAYLTFINPVIAPRISNCAPGSGMCLASEFNDENNQGVFAEFDVGADAVPATYIGNFLIQWIP